MKEKMLDGKIALITGASYGMGLDMAKVFAKEGANIIITARGEKRLNQALEKVKECLTEGRRAVAVTADVTTDNKPEQNNITKKHNAVNTEVNPVRPPASTPVNDSTNEVVDDVPKTDPITVAVESANNALSPSTK